MVRGNSVMGVFRVAVTTLLVLLVAACAHTGNLPINLATADANAGLAVGGEPIATLEDDLLIGLAFSGGGTRAAAFSFGVLQEIDQTEMNRRGRKLPLIDHTNFVSGVSGGSVI